MTKAQRAEDEKLRFRIRLKKTIETVATYKGMTLKDVARQSGINYDRMLRHLDSDNLTAVELMCIGKTLGFDPDSYAEVFR